MLSAILLAAGKSKRFGKKDKLLLILSGKPVIQWPLETLARHPLVDEVIVVEKRNGGKTRQESIFRALQKIKKQKLQPEFLLIHNAANPFITEDEIFRCVYFLQKNRMLSGVAVARPITDTVKLAASSMDPSGAHPLRIVQRTLDRDFLWAVETPQVVRFQLFLEAHQKAQKAKFVATDDLALLEWHGKKTALIEASPNNFKITNPRDYELAKILVGDLPKNIRVGMAEDTHFFSRKHRGLHLGGLFFPDYPKLEANSDGDVILHALASAISQALGRGSLGTFATPLFEKGIRDSKIYLQKILRYMQKQKFSLQHVGLHLQGHEPKIDPLATQLKSSLAAILKIPKEKIGITAETGEEKNHKLRCSAAVTIFSWKFHEKFMKTKFPLA